jgi:ribosomal protein S6--L-glutamate ligase
MKIHLLLDEQAHTRRCAAFAAATTMLAERGFTVSRGVPEAALLCPERLCPRHDLYVLDSRSELAMSVAAVLHDRGGRFLNAYPACALAQNRITAASRLAAASVPLPRSWVTADFARLCELVAEHPVVVKAHSGACSTPPVVAQGPDDLAGIPLGEHPVLVQEFVPRHGPDLKLHAIGEHLFALQLPECGNAATPIPVSRELRAIALRCSRVFGLGVFALDLVQGAGGAVVTDVDHAPSFAGVPEAAPLLAQHIENVLGGRTPLPRQPPTLHVSPGWSGFLQGAAA